MSTKNIAFLLALAISLPALSQNEGKNMGKVNLPAFALKGFNLQYERQLTQRITVALGYGKIPGGSIPFRSYIEKQIDDPNVSVADFRLRTSIFTPEVRFYLGKKGAFRGFYLAPYARIGTYNITGPIKFVTVTATTTEKRTAIFDGKLQTVTAGLLLGSSFKLSNRLYLDWWIIGASIGSGSGDFAAVTPLSKDDQTSLQKTLNDLNVPFTKTRSQVNSNGATITTTGTMIGVRGLGINIGYRF